MKLTCLSHHQLFSCGYLVEILIMKYNGVGHAITTLTVDNMLILIKVTLAIQCTYYACVNCIKFSILCMYLRIGTSTGSSHLALAIHFTLADSSASPQP